MKDYDQFNPIRNTRIYRFLRDFLFFPRMLAIRTAQFLRGLFIVLIITAIIAAIIAFFVMLSRDNDNIYDPKPAKEPTYQEYPY